MKMFDENGEWKLNPSYKEIARLNDLLNNSCIPHTYCRFMDGWQICLFKEGKRVGDVIEHNWSYGHEDDRLEVYGFGLEDPVGWQTAEDAFEYFEKAWK